MLRSVTNQTSAATVPANRASIIPMQNRSEPMPITKAASLADSLVQQFEQKIERGELPPGSRFPTEKVVTEEFGVSRTVVREAFARLTARGLLISKRGSGAYVADGAQYRAFQVTPQEVSAIEDVLKLLEMRMGFETEMAQLAAVRRSDDDLAAMRMALDAMGQSQDVDASIAADAAFHGAIAHATGNIYYTRFTEFLGVRFIPSRRLYLQADDPVIHAGYAATINRDHLAIYKAIAAGDAAKAGRAARQHMQKSFERYDALAGRAFTSDPTATL
ncbi:FadR family transcriptional regulator [Sphingomonadaceae bacterium OTU29THOMA1]|nr:FadR family transcriptional regulator [Sphingomonadaceae bacterium OTU29THOMA1]